MSSLLFDSALNNVATVSSVEETVTLADEKVTVPDSITTIGTEPWQSLEHGSDAYIDVETASYEAENIHEEKAYRSNKATMPSVASEPISLLETQGEMDVMTTSPRKEPTMANQKTVVLVPETQFPPANEEGMFTESEDDDEDEDVDVVLPRKRVPIFVPDTQATQAIAPSPSAPDASIHEGTMEIEAEEDDTVLDGLASLQGSSKRLPDQLIDSPTNSDVDDAAVIARDVTPSPSLHDSVDELEGSIHEDSRAKSQFTNMAQASMELSMAPTEADVSDADDDEVETSDEEDETEPTLAPTLLNSASATRMCEQGPATAVQPSSSTATDDGESSEVTLTPMRTEPGADIESPVLVGRVPSPLPRSLVLTSLATVATNLETETPEVSQIADEAETMPASVKEEKESEESEESDFAWSATLRRGSKAEKTAITSGSESTSLRPTPSETQFRPTTSETQFPDENGDRPSNMSRLVLSSGSISSYEESQIFTHCGLPQKMNRSPILVPVPDSLEADAEVPPLEAFGLTAVPRSAKDKSAALDRISPQGSLLALRGSIFGDVEAEADDLVDSEEDEEDVTLHTEDDDDTLGSDAINWNVTAKPGSGVENEHVSKKPDSPADVFAFVASPPLRNSASTSTKQIMKRPIRTSQTSVSPVRLKHSPGKRSVDRSKKSVERSFVERTFDHDAKLTQNADWHWGGEQPNFQLDSQTQPSPPSPVFTRKQPSPFVQKKLSSPAFHSAKTAKTSMKKPRSTSKSSAKKRPRSGRPLYDQFKNTPAKPKNPFAKSIRHARQANKKAKLNQSAVEVHDSEDASPSFMQTTMTQHVRKFM